MVRLDPSNFSLGTQRFTGCIPSMAHLATIQVSLDGALLMTYFADDTCFAPNSDEGYGFEKATRAGLVRGSPFGGPLYPQVCGPTAI